LYDIAETGRFGEIGEMPHTAATPLGIPYLAEFRSRVLSGTGSAEESARKWVDDNTLLAALGLNLRETYAYLYSQTPSLEQFEAWILAINGGSIEPARIARLNAALAGDGGEAPAAISAGPPVLSAADLAFWNENGYVVVHDAVPPENCRAAAQAIYDFLAVDPDRPDTWYTRSLGHTIWVPLLHHPALWANRNSPRIHRAFAQIWQRADLWVNVDQAGFNPPERPGWPFPGPHLHWDVSLVQPIPFGVQGILYLTDTSAEQGAFTCVPGFHRIIEDWLNGLPPGADPRAQDLRALGPVPIAGRASDLIIWHQALPHGASPNRAQVPRVAQYLMMRPSQWDAQTDWR
jgi:ectoine hydroxylase-related dioxygenase (phytanoyl-CoA dioxygenase family)